MKPSRHLIIPTLAVCLLGSPLQAVAQQSIASQETQVTGGTLTLIAYLVLWGLIAAALIAISLKQKKLDEELRAIEHKLDSHFAQRDHTP